MRGQHELRAARLDRVRTQGLRLRLRPAVDAAARLVCRADRHHRCADQLGLQSELRRNDDRGRPALYRHHLHRRAWAASDRPGVDAALRGARLWVVFDSASASGWPSPTLATTAGPPCPRVACPVGPCPPGTSGRRNPNFQSKSDHETLTRCDLFGIPSTSLWTGAATIAR